MDKKQVAALLIVTLISSVAVCLQTVQADGAADASTPTPSSAIETQTWVVIVLTAVLVGVYIAVIVFLIVKKNKP